MVVDFNMSVMVNGRGMEFSFIQVVGDVKYAGTGPDRGKAGAKWGQLNGVV